MRNDMWKKAVSAVLALVLAVPGMAPVVQAAEPETNDLDAFATFSSQVSELIQTYSGPGVSFYGVDGEPDEFATGRLVVKSKEEVDPLNACEVVCGYRDLHVLQFPTPEAAEAAYEVYSAMDHVIYVEPDTICDVTPVDPSAAAENGGISLLSKSYYNSWGYEEDVMNMNAYHDWLLDEVGSESSLPEITVAVVDTGVNLRHSMFEGRLVSSGYDFVNGDADATDDNGHGSHVAGIVVDGTLSNVKILPVKVLGENNSGTTLQVVMGIYYAADQGVDVINMSLGGYGYKYLEKEAIDYAVGKGIPVIVAAGNESIDAGNKSPACFDNVITVAAATYVYDYYMGEYLEEADYTNTGSVVDVTAPGTDVYSSYLPWDEEYVDGYNYLSGTSMATPHVTAAAAMLLSYDSYTPGEIELMLEKACTIEFEYSYWTEIPNVLCMADLIPDSATVTELTISRTTAVGCPGQSFKLDVAPSANVKWKSSNAAVAEVDAEGNVTCKKAGTATITASVGSVSATCSVTVNALELTMEPATLYPGGACTLVCKTNCDPAPALTWSIAEADKGKLDFLKFEDYEQIQYPVGSTSAAVEASADVTQEVQIPVTASFGDTKKEVIVTITLPEIDWYDPDILTYHIKTEEELREMAAVLTYGDVDSLEGKTVYLDNDIALQEEWTVIPSFGGTFDGQNHVISGLYINGVKGNYVGLFSDLGPDSIVKNLSLTDVDISVAYGYDYCYVGAIAGSLVGGKIEDCSVEGWIWGENYVGGIAGRSTGIITGCSVAGDISGSNYTGGIAGGSTGSIYKCSNSAYVGGSDYVGGICGHTTRSISDCNNAGAVWGMDVVGGIAGYSSYSIGDCTNSGNVDGYGSVAGICGQGVNISIQNCVNNGTVSGFGECIAGIVGEELGDWITEVEVEGCTNHGAITGEDYSSYIGGICGKGYAMLLNCLNTGAISAGEESWNIGGICGYIVWGDMSEVMANCINTGDVSGDVAVGGIAGEARYLNIENCVSLGTVTGNDGVGSICGYSPYTDVTSTLTSCYAAKSNYSGGEETKCGVVSATTLRTSKSWTVGSYTGRDLVQLLNHYALLDYEREVEEWELPGSFCFWQYEDGQWLRASAISVPNHDPITLVLDRETRISLTTIAAAYRSDWKMVDAAALEFWDDVRGYTYLAKPDLSVESATRMQIFITDYDYIPQQESIPLEL